MKGFSGRGFIYRIMLMPPNQQNQYDFILNDNQKPKRGLKFGNSTGSRIAIIIIGIILIIIAVSVINSFLGKESKAHTQQLTEVAKAQSEIIRVSTLAAKDAKDPKTRNYALNTKLSVQSSQIEVKKLLNARGVKDKGLNKKLGASKNTKNDDTLKEGSLNNRYDETFVAIINQQLADYQKLTQAAFESGNSKEKKALTAAFENAGRLAIKQESAP